MNEVSYKNMKNNSIIEPNSLQCDSCQYDEPANIISELD